MKRLVILLALGLSACSGKDNPNNPTPTTGTRLISVTGSLNFGPIAVGTSVSDTLHIENQGTAPLTITGMSGPCGSFLSASFSAGVIQPHATEHSTIRFAPTAVQNCSGTVTVSGDQTAGGNTLPITASGKYTNSGSGDTVFDMPTYIRRIRVVGVYNGYGSNFIVRIGGSLAVNEILGDTTIGIGRRYEGTLQTTGGAVVITNSSGVQWSFEETR